jgi:hypothetical protein
VGFGQSLTASTPKAHADTTGMAVVGCEFIAPLLDEVDADADVEKACNPASMTEGDLELIAEQIGDEDGTLELSDFSSEELDESWDDNQISTDCTWDAWDDGDVGDSYISWAIGLACTLDVFVFTDNEAAVVFDAPDGLSFTTTDAGSNDYTCDTDGEDADCSSVTPNNGDEIVVNGVLVDGGDVGDVLEIAVTQAAVEQTADINVVGSPNDVKLTLAEDLIETSASTSEVEDCQTGVPTTDAIDPPNSTLAWAQAFDAEDNVLTRVPVIFSINPPDDLEKAKFGLGDEAEELVSITYFTLDPVTAGAPVASYIVVCGGKESGEVTVTAEINLIVPPDFSSYDQSSQDLTVGGVPSSVNVTASASSIKCDGSQTATVTAKVTDDDGNNVADGVPVNFSVVALGTANPINTVTEDGEASTTITPLSNSSAGVTVIVTAGDYDLAEAVQTSIRVDCALPLETQPTLAPPVVVPTARTGIGGPDTGNGGYLGQSSSSSFPMWTLIALALGSMTLVAGGVVARRTGK